MARYFSEFGHVALRPGELVYLAVDSNEPPGKPIVACRKVQVAFRSSLHLRTRVRSRTRACR